MALVSSGQILLFKLNFGRINFIIFFVRSDKQNKHSSYLKNDQGYQSNIDCL
jgi:hypothetical protein